VLLLLLLLQLLLLLLLLEVLLRLFCLGSKCCTVRERSTGTHSAENIMTTLMNIDTIKGLPESIVRLPDKYVGQASAAMLPGKPQITVRQAV
jgi:hypothetical protein